MINVTSLAVRAGQNTLLQDLSFSVPAGSILAVLGPNGRGKTTLLRTMMHLLPAAAGTVTLGGHAAYVPQHTESHFAYDVLSMVAMGRARHLKWYATPGKEDMAIAQQALHAVGLQHLAHRACTALSGGEKQLVSIARAIASQSEIMLLDEPAAALDLHNQDIVLSVLRSLAQQRGMTIVFTTHQPQHALHIADQTLLMQTDTCDIGPTIQICNDDALSRLYRIQVRTISLQEDGRQLHGVMPIYR